MTNYIKLFETTSQYNEYINGSDVVFPNVSVAKDAPKKVYYNPIPFFVKLFLNNGEVVELQGSGELTQAMITPYKKSVVSAEFGKLCTSIGDNAFYQCKGLTSVTIGNGVTTIGSSAFISCSSLTSITIGNSVTNIDSYAFFYCSGLTNIVIPNSVTSIGSSAFNGCTGLTSVTIGSGVTSIGGYAFNFCTGLTSIKSLAVIAPTIQSSTFQNVKTNGTLSVPIASSGYDIWMGTSNYYLGCYGWNYE